MHSKGLHVVILKALIKLRSKELVVMWVNYKPIDDGYKSKYDVDT